MNVADVCDPECRDEQSECCCDSGQTDELEQENEDDDGRDQTPRLGENGLDDPREHGPIGTPRA